MRWWGEGSWLLRDPRGDDDDAAAAAAAGEVDCVAGVPRSSLSFTGTSAQYSYLSLWLSQLARQLAFCALLAAEEESEAAEEEAAT
jgi:hypothetical protein